MPFRKVVVICAVIYAASRPMSAAVQAQEKEPAAETLSAEKVKSEIERLRLEIEAQRMSPLAPKAWKDLLTAEARLEKARASKREEIDAIRQEVSKLSTSRAAVRWGKPISKMELRLGELEVADWKITRDDGSRIFQARHAELSKLKAAETPELHGLGLTILNYPRMDGSTSCQPLAALIACRCFGAPYAWVGTDQRLPKDPFDDDSFSLAFLLGESEPELKLLEFTLQARADRPADHRLALIINRLLAHNASTHQAYVNLIEGKSEIGLLARAPSPDELDLARMQNVDLDVSPCALDAFVFLVNKANTVATLTTSQIRDIYAGKIENWNQVGGSEKQITPYQREENSGSQQLMRNLIMKDVPFEKPKGEFAIQPQLVERLMSSIFLALTSDKGGLGYSVYYYERFMSGSPRTRIIAVDGVEPTFDSIRQHRYPLTTEIFVVTRKGIDRADPAALLRNWLRSPEGQAVVRESGYIPIPTGN